MARAPTSINDLNAEAAVDPDLILVLAYDGCDEIAAQSNQVRDDGLAKLKEQEKIEAYVLLKRSVNLAEVLEMTDSEQYLQSQEGQAFVETVEATKAQLLVLAEEVEPLIYDTVVAKEVDTSLNSNNPGSEPGTKGPFDREEGDDFYKTIEPLQLLTLAKKLYIILLVDFRVDTNVRIDIQDSADLKEFPFLTIGYCHPEHIKTHLPLVYLSRSLPESERDKFLPEKLTKCDLVVLMNDDGPVYDEDNRLVTPALDLMNALTVYASIHKLRRDPVFLKGGFNKWRQDCPAHVLDPTGVVEGDGGSGGQDNDIDVTVPTAQDDNKMDASVSTAQEDDGTHQDDKMDDSVLTAEENEDTEKDANMTQTNSATVSERLAEQLLHQLFGRPLNTESPNPDVPQEEPDVEMTEGTQRADEVVVEPVGATEPLQPSDGYNPTPVCLKMSIDDEPLPTSDVSPEAPALNSESTISLSTARQSISPDSAATDFEIMDMDTDSNSASKPSKSIQFSSILLEFTLNNDVIVRADDSYTGNVIFPAYIRFVEGVPTIGGAARSALSTDPKSVVYDIPILLSEDFNPAEPNPAWQFTTSLNENGTVCVEAGGTASTAFFVFAAVLMDVVNSIKEHFPKPLDCVSVKLPVVPLISDEGRQQLCILLDCNVVILN